MRKNTLIVRTPFYGLIPALLLAVVVNACAGVWGYGDVPAGGDPGRALYLRKCGSCHTPFPAHSYTAAQWPGVINGMATEAGLSVEEIHVILNWLEENS